MRTITSVRNPAVKAARKLARGPAGGAFLVEGPAVVAEAADHLERLFATPAALATHPDVVERARRTGADIVTVAEPVVAALTATVTPQGLVGVARLAGAPLGAALAGARLVVVCHEVRDPGNVGTIVRTADAAGGDAVVLTGASVDPRNPKAVRASAGSLFHLPVVSGVDWADAARACRDAGLSLLAADARGGAAHTETDLGSPVALVFGGEARGLDEAVRGGCDGVVTVPVHGRAESLNLAAAVAVLVYEAARQRSGRPAATAVPT